MGFRVSDRVENRDRVRATYVFGFVYILYILKPPK